MRTIVVRAALAAGTAPDRLSPRFEPRGEAAADLLVSWENTRLVLPLRRVGP